MGSEDGWSPYRQGFYKPSRLRKLFRLYSTLTLVEWVADHPSHPFILDEPSVWAERNVKCGVYRPVEIRDEAAFLLPHCPT